MIVEFIGSTGAGKTTLISEVQQRLAGQAHVATSFELVAGLLGLRRVRNRTARNLIQDLAGLPFFIGSLYHYRAFVTFALEILSRHKGHGLFTANYMRSIMRKIGTHEIFKRYNHDQIILVDEGTVLSAHLLFVFNDTRYTDEDITKFATLIPLPDIIVYVRAPVDSLIRRTLQRTDPPREIRSKDPVQIETYVSRAATMFDQLVNVETIRRRVLVVENPDTTDEYHDTVVSDIAESLLGFQRSNHLVPTKGPL